MSIVDEVRRALQPMIDQGLVHAVQIAVAASYQPRPDPNPHEAITVMVNADDPEAHRVDIEKLLLQAGLKVDLRLQKNPSRAREDRS